jgi:hypothetical protein
MARGVERGQSGERVGTGEVSGDFCEELQGKRESVELGAPQIGRLSGVRDWILGWTYIDKAVGAIGRNCELVQEFSRPDALYFGL